MIMLNFSVCIILVLAFNQALNASSLAIERQNDVIYVSYIMRLCEVEHYFN